jgi:hypothetical protein
LKRLLAASPAALAITKSYSDAVAQLPLDSAMALAKETLASLLDNPQNTKAISQFLDGGGLPWMVKYKRKRCVDEN